MTPRSGFTLTQLLVVVAAIAATGALFLPSLAASRRASNERMASTVLKTMTAAEADFRANDRDGNGVNDFWTGDVKGLYTMTPARIPGATRLERLPQIRLIELGVAASDADGRFVPAGGLNTHLETLARPAPRHGYWILALGRDRREGGPMGVPYRQDTGGSPPTGLCHHREKFGFCAIPDTRTAGKFAFIVNENNSLRRLTLDRDDLWSGDATPPGLEAAPPELRDWPSDAELGHFWSTC